MPIIYIYITSLQAKSFTLSQAKQIATSKKEQTTNIKGPKERPYYAVLGASHPALMALEIAGMKSFFLLTRPPRLKTFVSIGISVVAASPNAARANEASAEDNNRSELCRSTMLTT